MVRRVLKQFKLLGRDSFNKMFVGQPIWERVGISSITYGTDVIPLRTHVTQHVIASNGNQLRKGVREVQKFIRKGEKGICILAGDVSPIDVFSHLPYACEETGIPYCYTPSKEDLGAAINSNRQTCVVLVKPHDDYKEHYDECFSDVSNLPMPV